MSTNTIRISKETQTEIKLEKTLPDLPIPWIIDLILDKASIRVPIKKNIPQRPKAPR